MRDDLLRTDLLQRAWEAGENPATTHAQLLTLVNDLAAFIAALTAQGEPTLHQRLRDHADGVAAAVELVCRCDPPTPGHVRCGECGGRIAQGEPAPAPVDAQVYAKRPVCRVHHTPKRAHFFCWECRESGDAIVVPMEAASPLPVAEGLEQADPTEADLADPQFEAIWQVIKSWDICTDGTSLYHGATGTDVVRVLTALRAVAEGRSK